MSIISCITNNGYESGIAVDDTPEKLQQAVQAGVAEDYWSIGDAFPIKLNGTVGAKTFKNETYYAFIIGFDHNSDLEGNDTIHFQFGKTEDGTDILFIDDNYDSNGSTNGFRMNISNSNQGGWESSYMRQTICPAFLDALPKSWQTVITDCKKYTDNVGDAGGNTEHNISLTEDKIFLPSVFEVFGDTSFANSYEQYAQEQYEYYANGNSSIKYKYNNTGALGYWWLRSVNCSSRTNFCFAGTGGSVSSINAHYSCGFAPCFQIS